MRVLEDLLVIVFAFIWHICTMLGGILLIRLLAIVLAAVFSWFIGLFIGDTILNILAQIGISGFSMLQIGAFLGFIASFFTSPIRFADLRTKQPETTQKTPHF